MFKKISFIVIVIIFCAIIFSGYIHEQDLDDLAYVIAIGIDVGNDNNLEITFQVSIPSANSSSSESSSSSETESSSSQEDSSDTLNKSIECETINSGLYLANNIISKKIDLSHCKFVVFSEEIASQGIYEYIYTLENNLELRSNCNILVSTCDAKEFLESSNPILENSTAKYYEIISTASKYTGYTSNITLNSVFTSISDTFGEVCTILGHVKEEENDSSEIMLSGIAVFKGDKMVGTLSVDETIPYLIVTNKLNECTISTDSPFSENKQMDFHVSVLSPTQHTITFDNASPHITTNIFLEATLLSSSDDFNAASPNDVSQVEEVLSNYVKEEVEKYFEKTSKEYKSDISKLGKYIVYQFPTQKDWTDFDWVNKYEQASFNVNVDVNINFSYFISHDTNYYLSDFLRSN